MLDPANILIHIHPIGGVIQICRLPRARRREPCKIPRRIHKRVHRIGLTLGRLAAFRASRVAPSGMPVERIARNIKRHIIGQLDWQVFFLLGHHTAGVAMHNGDRTAPIALTAQAPIAQTVIGDAFAPARSFGKFDCLIDRLLARRHVQTCEMVDPLHFVGFRRHEGLCRYGCRVAFGKECINHRQIILPAEIQIALIMRRASKNGACAVIHQNEVRDPDGQLPIGVERVFDLQPCVKAALVGLLQINFRGAQLATFRIERGQFGIFRLKFL